MGTDNVDFPEEQEQAGRGHTRRTVIQRGAVGALGLAAAGSLAACGSDDKTKTTTTDAGPPKRGGTLTLGMISAGQSETLVPGKGLNLSDSVRARSVYDVLFSMDAKYQAVPALATSAEPNADATVWTLQLRDGVTWHDGKPLTADDVVYSMKAWFDPDVTSFGAGPFTGILDAKGVRKRGNLTVEVTLKQPVSNFPEWLYLGYTFIIQEGATAESLNKKPIGTGPFKVESFTPGKSSVMVANRDYWQHGGPYVDSLTVNSSFADENARIEALLSGTVDAVPSVAFARAKSLESGGQKLIRAAGPGMIPFVMPVKQKGPLADVRVRQAFRLLVDRQQFVDTVFAGYARVANDVPGAPGVTFFDDSLKREQDIEQAKSLLKAAGQSDLRITLPTAPITDGQVQSAILFQEQAKAAGVTVAVDQQTAEVYFTPKGGYGGPFFQDTWWSAPGNMGQFWTWVFNSAGFSETAWGNAATDKQMYAAIGETDKDAAQQKWNALQQAQFDEGGYLIPANPEFVDAVAKNVQGITPSPLGWMNGWRLLDAWKS